MDNLGVFLIVVFVTCVTPGAGVLYTLNNAINFGLKNAYLSPTGNALGVLVMSIVAASGLGAIVHANDTLFYGLQTAGCLLMIWFGYKSWTAPTMNLKKLSAVGSKAKEQKNAAGILISAAVLQLTNPMLIVFLLSLMPQFINPKENYFTQVSELIAIFVGICWLVHIVYSYSAAFAADRWMNARFSFWLNKISASLFWILSLTVLLHIYHAF